MSSGQAHFIPDATPEQSLLLLCARRDVDDDAAARIREIAGSDPDWAALIAAATAHSVAPLLFRRLDEFAGSRVPDSWRERFREEFERNARRNLFLSAELFRVLAALEAAGTRPVPYKGPVVAMQAYGDIALRQFADLDIILPQREMPAAHGALTGLGFRAEIPGLTEPQAWRKIPGQYVFANPIGTHVELHSEATLRYMPRRLDLEPLLARREVISLGGKPVTTFSTEDTLVLLAVHGSKHFWDRLGWIADIAGISQGPRPIHWDVTLERASQLGARRMVLLAASLAAELFDAPVPAGILAAVAQDGGARELCRGVSQHFLAAQSVEPGLFGRASFRIRMHGGGLPGLRYAVRLATAPTEVDRRENSAAERFEPLHAILRPLRLARQYGWRKRTPNSKASQKVTSGGEHNETDS